MKIALSRYRNKGNVTGLKSVRLPNGFRDTENVNKFSFVYANLSQSISAQLSTLGNSQNSTKLIATLDNRFKDYLDDTHGDQITINGQSYDIKGVSLDDTDVMNVYRITIAIKDSYGDGDSGY